MAILSYRNNDTSYRDELLGGSWHAPRKNFEMIDAIW